MKQEIRFIFGFILIGISISILSCNGGKGGISDPLPYTNISNTELQKLLFKKDVTLIDIRRPEEWKATGVIPKSETLTYLLKDGDLNPYFTDTLKKLVTQDQPVALISRTGKRTRDAGRYLAKRLGYSQVYNVKYGILAWKDENKRIVPYLSAK